MQKYKKTAISFNHPNPALHKMKMGLYKYKKQLAQIKNNPHKLKTIHTKQKKIT
jgi:hypothetical protein